VHFPGVISEVHCFGGGVGIFMSEGVALCILGEKCLLIPIKRSWFSDNELIRFS
jgi:hypothetical protein